jgi:hypothetical protein
MTDWYIDQMKTKTYESEPLPISFTHDQYVDKLDYVFTFQNRKQMDIKDLSFLLKTQNRLLACRMDKRYILSNK